MSANRNQQTLRRAVVVNGVGYWSGAAVKVEFRPAFADSGVTFVRLVEGRPERIPVAIAYQVETPRRTSLVRGAARVEMIEHIMAALVGLQVDNCDVWMSQNEAPGFDGSALAFVDAIQSVGLRRQTAIRKQIVLTETVRVGDDDVWVEAEPTDNGELIIRYELDYGDHSSIQPQEFQASITPETFHTQLASARTFLLESEAEQLRNQGIAQHVTFQDLLVFNESGPIDNDLRFDDECVRHKALDVVGDLALAGADVVGRITAHCSGHRLNAELVRAILGAQGQVQLGAA